MIKADTSIDQLTSLVTKACSDPRALNSLIKALAKIIPVKKLRRTEIMIDKNINELFNVRRIGYNALVKILPSDEVGMYNASVIKITSGETLITEGSSLTISKRELQINGRHSSSIE